MRSLTPSRTAADRYLRSPLGVREVKQGGSTSDCPTVRRWHRCDLPAEKLLCVNQPTDIWVCDYPANDAKIRYLNACYERTEDTVDTTELPDSATFVPPGGVYQIEADCDDNRCTECNLYYKAELCPRQANPPSYELFVPVEDVEACGAICYGGFGWYVRPGPVFTLEQVLERGGERCPIHQCSTYVGDEQADCCNLTCIPNCGVTTRGNRQDCGLGEIPGSSLRCCCSQDYSFSINWSCRDETHVTNNLLVPPPAYEAHSITTSGTSIAGTVEGGVVTWLPTGIAPEYTVLQQNYSVPPQVTDGDFTYTYPHFPPASCVPEAAVPTPFGPIVCPAGGPWTTGDDINFTTVTRASSSADCFNATLRFSSETYALDLQTGARVTRDYTITIRISPLGLCGGGCPGGGGASSSAGLIARGLAMAAIGRRLWDIGVSPVAFLEF